MCSERIQLPLHRERTYGKNRRTTVKNLQSPYRLRCIELMRSAFGRGVFACRGAIERTFGALTSFGGGLSPLPSWVRHLNRVWLWVSAKLVINGVRIMALRKELAA